MCKLFISCNTHVFVMKWSLHTLDPTFGTQRLLVAAAFFTAMAHLTSFFSILLESIHAFAFLLGLEQAMAEQLTVV